MATRPNECPHLFTEPSLHGLGFFIARISGSSFLPCAVDVPPPGNGAVVVSATIGNLSMDTKTSIMLTFLQGSDTPV